MCGITGIIDFREAVPEADLARFTAALSHRGPDGAGTWRSDRGDVGLGHRRLAILDPTPAGHQPMTLGSRYVLSYNGEVYNFLELRAELQAAGHVFRTDTDTEVVLAAYAQWGPACLGRFNGMWAIAIYDRRERTLWLARDRYGIKPLHYAYEPSRRRFTFASETVAYRSLTGFARAVDPGRLRACLADARALEPTGETIWVGIRQLRPGHTLTLDAGGAIRTTRWWRPGEHAGSRIRQPRDRATAWRATFDEACALRLRSDVPVASAVSGGLDSSSVYATVHHLAGAGSVARAPGEWQRGYVLSMPGSARDETAFAKTVAASLGQALTVVPVDYGDADTLVARTRLYDAVFDNPNFILHDLYGAMAADGVKVSLDGHGADELMYGYPHMIQSALELARWRDGRRYAGFAATLAAMLPGPHPPQAAVAPTTRRARVRRVVGALARGLSRAALPPLPAAAYGDIVRQQVYGGTLEAILRNFDRASMAVGVEIRMPFLDHRVVAATHALTIDDHVRAPFAKATLREAMRGRLPEAIRLRADKIGLMAPLDELLSGRLRGLVADLTASRAFRESPHWDGRAVAAEVHARLSSGRTWDLGEGMRLWPLLNAHLLLA